MLTAEKWYQHQVKYVKYGIDMRPADHTDETAENNKRYMLTGQDKLRLLLLILVIGALAIAGVVTTAYAAQIKYNINVLNKENAVIQGEIENLNVSIKAANNIKTIEEKAAAELGMVYPTYDQMVFLPEEPQKVNDFAMVLKEQAYN